MAKDPGPASGEGGQSGSGVAGVHRQLPVVDEEPGSVADQLRRDQDALTRQRAARHEIDQLEIPEEERLELLRRAQEGEREIEWVRSLNPKVPIQDSLGWDEDLAKWRARREAGIMRAPCL